MINYHPSMLFIDLVITSSLKCGDCLKGNLSNVELACLKDSFNDKLQSIQTDLNMLYETRMEYFKLNEFEMYREDEIMFESRAAEVTNQITAAIENITMEVEQQINVDYQLSQRVANSCRNKHRKAVISVELNCILKSIVMLQTKMNYIKTNLNQFYIYLIRNRKHNKKLRRITARLGENILRLEEYKNSCEQFNYYNNNLELQKEQINTFQIRINQ